MSLGVEGPGVDEAEALPDLAVPATSLRASQYYQYILRYRCTAAYS